MKLPVDGLENIQPVLLPPFVEFAPAYQVAPPVAVERLSDKKSAATMPDDLDNVCDAAAVEPIVSNLPASPFAFQFVNVFVVPFENKMDVAPVAL